MQIFFDESLLFMMLRLFLYVIDFISLTKSEIEIEGRNMSKRVTTQYPLQKCF